MKKLRLREVKEPVTVTEVVRDTLQKCDEIKSLLLPFLWRLESPLKEWPFVPDTAVNPFT